jgi:hypothetical protein
MTKGDSTGAIHVLATAVIIFDLVLMLLLWRLLPIS